MKREKKEIDFMNRLIKERKSKSLSQFDVAIKMGTTQQSISRYENGQSMPSLNNLIKYCEALDLNIYDIFK